MALFTDGPASTMEDLAGQDSQLLDVANTEGIDVGRKLASAQDELGVDLAGLLNRGGWEGQPFWLASAPDVSHVVVTPPLRLWHAFRTLELVYGEAYYNQLSERYSGKRDAFHDMAAWAREKLIELGIGIASDPVARAATPVVQTTAGNLPTGIYYVTMAWVNAAGEEGACASPAVASTAGNTLLALPQNAPANAKSWNVYVGQGPDSMTLQSASPIPAGQSWTQSNPVATTGRAPGLGQAPNYLFAAPRTLQRG
ncbi:MAG: hypothetical protein ABSC23_08700 [Bryobacteraceae bacterium]|jgi:hypothetical protein